MSRTMRHAPPSSHSAEPSQRKYPKSIYTLVSLLCLYLAAPLYDVPLLGLSLSAPLLFLLILQVQTRYGGLRLRRLGMLPRLLVLVWAGQLFSLAYNEVMGDPQFEITVGMITLIRYAYWFLIACVSAQLFFDEQLSKKAAQLFGYGCMIMAAFVLLEYLLRGGLLETGLSALTTLSQNSYGWQFSAFAPYALYLMMSTSANKRPLAIAGFIMVLMAVLINASRSSWGTVILGLALYSLLWAITAARKTAVIKGLLVMSLLLLLTAGALMLLPEQVLSKPLNRPITAEDIARDKSWQIRQLMIQKGQMLFMESPIFGFGPGQFRYTQAELDLPQSLTYESKEYFNTKSSHNSYIQLLAEGGLLIALPMGILLLWLLIKGGQATLRLARSGEDWTIPVYVSFICFSTHFWTLSGITSTAPWFLYGMTAAIILRARAIERQALSRERVNRFGTTARIPLSHSR